jgi:hypothetical protein
MGRTNEIDAEAARRADADARRFGWLAAIRAAAAAIWLTA